ncbi:MAG: rhomboid family intramembrane serine protease [Candidatus Acidiferrales bacterium]
MERWKSAVRGFFGIGGNDQPRPQICPACGALVGISATRCHECGTSLRFSLAALSKGLSGFFGGRAPVTTGLLIVNIIMFGLSLVATMKAGEAGGLSILWGMNGEVLDRLGDSYPSLIFNAHQWYRLVTAMFLHGGLIHIGFNMMVLMDIGPVVEEVYGSARYLFLYTITGAIGFLLSAVTGHKSVGASGAILGMIGVMIAMTTKRGGATMQALRSRLVSWVVSIFVFGFLLRGVDNWAHFGGLAAGFGLGKLLTDREPASASERQTAYALGWLAAIVLVASFAMMLLHFQDKLPGT